MINIYKTNENTGKLDEIKNVEKGCWINIVSPTEQEIVDICNLVNIEQDIVRYPLDYEERARIDSESDVVLAIIDIPTIEITKNGDICSTLPLGMIIVRDDYFITVCLQNSPIIQEFVNGRVKTFFTFKKTRFILQILYKNAVYFLSYLKQINKETENTEILLQKSMKNKELIKLLNIEKSLVYFTTSITANEGVMEKILRGRVLKLYDEDEDILEDAIVENRQAMEMSKIYSDILGGMMDAYASIISNNLNIVMKFLASVTIVLSLPTLVASFFGMNVGLPFENNGLGFVIIVSISILISAIAAFWLKKKNMF